MSVRAVRSSVDGTQVVTLHDQSTGAEAEVVVDVGSNLHRFRVPLAGRTVEVLAAAPDMATLRERPTRWGSAVLFPYPGRVEAGRFTFEGRAITLPTGPDGNAIHGVARARPFEVVSMDGQVRTRLDSQIANVPASEWPFPFTLTLTTTLADATVRVASEVVNTGEVPMPFGLGFHPYFPASPDDEVWVEADERWEQAGPGLPTGQAERLGPDDGLRRSTRLADIPPRVRSAEGDVRNQLFRRPAGSIAAGVRYPRAGYEVILTSGDDVGALVFFTPAAPPLVSLEPHTCVPNALNLQPRGVPAGLLVLQPGARWRGWWQLAVRPL